MRNLIYVAITPMLFVTSIIFDFNLLLSLIFFLYLGSLIPMLSDWVSFLAY
jgi:hypothetical protein